MEQVYPMTFECELCRETKHFNYSGLSEPFDLKVREQIADWVKHCHWCEVHRVCAKCGEYVKSNELDVAANDGRITIHSAYTHEYRKIKSGDIEHLLTVHRQCKP